MYTQHKKTVFKTMLVLIKIDTFLHCNMAIGSKSHCLNNNSKSRHMPQQSFKQNIWPQGYYYHSSVRIGKRLKKSSKY